MKGSGKTNKYKIGIICTVCVALAAVIAGIVLLICLGPDRAGNNNVDTSITDNTVETGKTSDFEEIAIGEGLVLTLLADSSGNFPELGANGDMRESMLCAVFENTSDRTLQYAKVKVSVGERDYSFEISTIPAGKSVYAFERLGARGDDLKGEVSCEAEYVVFFSEEPSLLSEDLEITVKDGAISVKNISGKDIDREISVFYKNTMDGFYLGGITYRVRLSDGLAAGESVSGYASHASKSSTEIMFCQYGV